MNLLNFNQIDWTDIGNRATKTVIETGIAVGLVLIPASQIACGSATIGLGFTFLTAVAGGVLSVAVNATEDLFKARRL